MLSLLVFLWIYLCNLNLCFKDILKFKLIPTTKDLLETKKNNDHLVGVLSNLKNQKPIYDRASRG